MAKQTLLLVDADPKSARVLEVSLRKAGYSVTHVRAAEAALEAIEISPPDLVLSDTKLAPEAGAASMDGYALCRKLKDDPVLCGVPFIFLTSSSSIEDKIRGLELGVEDYLTKPIYIKEILTRIQLVLAKKERDNMEARTSRASFSGLLSEMGLVDLLSTIDLGRKSGQLDITGPSGKGVVFFRDGRVVDAKTGRYVGAAAVYRMLLWNDGNFEIRFGPTSVDDTVDMSTQGLLMEGMRRLDEWQRLQEQLPPLDGVYVVDAKELGARLGEIPDEVNDLLRAIDGRNTLVEAVDSSGYDELSALATLSKLYFEGLIVPKGISMPSIEPPSAVVPASGMLTPTHGIPGAPALPVLPTDSVGLIGSISDRPDADARSDRPLAEPRGEVQPPGEPRRNAPGPSVEPALSATTPTREVEQQSDTDPLASQAERDNLSSAQSEKETASGSTADGNGKNEDDTTAAADTDGEAEDEEPSVAKHRGKRGRNKQDQSKGQRTGSGKGPAAQAATTEAVSDSERTSGTVAADVTGEKTATGTTAEPTVSAAPASAQEASESATRATTDGDNAPHATEAAVADAKVAETGSDGATAASNVIQFPKAAAGTAREDLNKTRPMGTMAIVLPDGQSESTSEAEAKPAEATSVPAPSGAKPAEEKEAEGQASAAPASSETVASTPPETAGKAEGQARSNKDTLPGTGPARGKKSSVPGASRERRGSGSSEREAKISFSGELTDEAKAFFSDQSYENAFKRTHDTFEDLKPSEEHPEDAAARRRLRRIAMLFVLVVPAVIGGLAIKRAYFDPAESSLAPPPRGEYRAPEDRGSGGTSASTSGSGGGTSSGSGSSGAAVADDSGASAASSSATDANAETTSATASSDAAASTTATSAQTDAGTSATAAGAGGADAAASSTQSSGTGAAADAAAAPQGPAALLTAAQRSRSRGTATAVAAYQAYLDGGGNDGGEIANFAYWLANRNDLTRAREWSERATQLDANSQLAWYVLGVSRRFGPSPDRAAAREAFQHCIALPGRYASECRASQ